MEMQKNMIVNDFLSRTDCFCCCLEGTAQFNILQSKLRKPFIFFGNANKYSCSFDTGYVLTFLRSFFFIMYYLCP